MANPEGAKAREPYQNFDGESQLSESTKPPARSALPLATNGTQEGLAGGLESGSKPSLTVREGWVR